MRRRKQKAAAEVANVCLNERRTNRLADRPSEQEGKDRGVCMCCDKRERERKGKHNDGTNNCSHLQYSGANFLHESRRKGGTRAKDHTHRQTGGICDLSFRFA